MGGDMSKQRTSVSESNAKSAEEAGLKRRDALAMIAKSAVYAAPATVALLSMEAKASSLTC